MKQQETIFVGVSGGVDSSVSAALLQQQGYQVVGVFIRTWQPEWLDETCTWRAERRDAMRVCAHLGIPFLECDMQDAYKQGVADYMIDEYRAGRTPNPDVMCNKVVKFGGFLEWARTHGADYVATGHYAQVQEDDGVYRMLRGKDEGKDQTYFLWTLTQEELQYIKFPIGHLPKSQVRTLARKFKLPTATKKDSQGICFIGEVPMKDFLAHYIDHTPGDVLDQAGQVIGSHDGALFFTMGERHGFVIHEKGTDDAPLYVVAKDIEKNTITVAPREYVETFDTDATSLEIRQVNDMSGKIIQQGHYTCQTRYHGEAKQCVIAAYDQDKQSVFLTFDESDRTLASGQSVVIYDGEECIGGGVIQ